MAVTKWTALGTRTEIINGDATTPTLKNLAAASRKVGNAVDNAANKNQYAHFELRVRYAVAPTTSLLCNLYLLPSSDGTNHSDGDDSTDPAENLLAWTFQVRGVSTQQLIISPPILIPATKFKPLLYNRANQAFTNTDNENELWYVTMNDETA